MIVNAETHNWPKYRELVSVEYTVTNGPPVDYLPGFRGFQKRG